MEVKYSDFGIYAINSDYLKYLRDADAEVYYSPERKNAPFTGICVEVGKRTYFVPFTTAKPRYIKDTNETADYFLVYEDADLEKLPKEAVYKPLDGNKVRHILAALSVSKMVPVPKGVCSKMDLDTLEDARFKDLLDKEYVFCKSRRGRILRRVDKIYGAQKSTGKAREYCCDFAALERACDAYASHKKKVKYG